MTQENNQHALLSASTAHRWLECTPSARLEQMEDGECTVYAEEGTEAHAYAELQLSYLLNKIDEETYIERKQEFMSTSKYFNKEFEEYVMSYVNYVVGRVNEIGKDNCKTYIECKLNFSNVVPQGFGTADTLIVTETSIIVVDLKFGKGVPVSAKNNPQLKLYAFGALNLFPASDAIEMVIYQPRLDSVDSDVVYKKDLVDWAFNYVAPRADEAVLGKGKLVAGEKQCRFCKLKGKCRARADMQLEVARQEFSIVEEEQKPVQQMSIEQIAKVLETAPMFINWFKDVEKYAMSQALAGVKIPGYKLVEGKSNRIITDPDKVKEILQSVGLTDDMIYKKREMEGLSKLEAIVGKKLFAELCGEYLVKPQGKPTLVSENDRRPEFSTLAIAQREFADVIEIDD